ncbi:unnamed protein product [Choristocarpus tenellus]
MADAGTAPYWDKGLLLDVTFAQVQVTSHLTHSSTSNGVAAAAAEAQKRTHYEGSFDLRSYNLNTFAVASFGCLDKQAECFLDELATHMVGGRGTGGYSRKGVVKSRLRQMVSVTMQVALPRRVMRFKLVSPERWARRGLLDSWDASLALPRGVQV